MKKQLIIFILEIFLLSAGIFRCELDHGLEPVDYKITGNVYFFMGEPPANTDRVEVFAIKEFPPQDPQNFLYLGRSGPLNYKNGRFVDYEIRVSPTSYQFIVALWKEKDQDWNLTGLVGYYTGPADPFLPDSVIVSKEKPIVEHVDFNANWELVSKDASIAGKITYEGEWPDDTSLLILAIYNKKPNPNNVFEYLTFTNIDYSQPIFTDSSSYKLGVNSGIYKYIVLFWVGKSISNFSDLIEIGFYEDPANPGTPGQISVSPNQALENININVNFANFQFP